MALERSNAGMSPAVASATMNWPWGTALVAGAGTGALNFLLNLQPNVLAVLPGALTTGIFFFALVGGAVMFLGKKGDRRARRYAGAHPWAVAAVPAALGGGGAAIISFIGFALTGSIIGGFFGALGTGLGLGALLWVILGVIAMVAGNRSS